MTEERVEQSNYTTIYSTILEQVIRALRLCLDLGALVLSEAFSMPTNKLYFNVF